MRIKSPQFSSTLHLSSRQSTSQLTRKFHSQSPSSSDNSRKPCLAQECSMLIVPTMWHAHMN